MEGLLNKKVGVDIQRGQISLENIMSSAGRLKVIPVFGDKGNIQKFEYKQDEPDELLTSVEDIRKVICNSVGIPYELIFQSDTVSKGEILRRYARYVRKLKNIQRAIADGIRQICYIHLTNKGISFTHQEIKIDFKNKLVEIDILNKLEFLDTTVSMLKNVDDFVTSNLGKQFPNRIDSIVLAEYYNKMLNSVGLGGLIMDEGEAQEKEKAKAKILHISHSEPASLASDDEEPNKSDEPEDEEPTEPEVVDLEDLVKG
jgi:hypothetical protein